MSPGEFDNPARSTIPRSSLEFLGGLGAASAKHSAINASG
jgi:hypothetical protein